MPLTLDALRVLDAIDRKQTFAGAAQALHRVPSAISYTISKLEEDLGVEVFDRSKRRAVLTAAGRLLLMEGRQLLSASEELAQKVQAVAGGWEARLRIAVDTVMNCDAIYDLVEEFREKHAVTELVLSEEVLGGTWEALTAQRCDLVIGAAGQPHVGGIVTHEMCQMEFVFAVAPSHPLCRRPQPLSPEDVYDYPTIVVSDSSRYIPGRSAGVLGGRTRLAVPDMAMKIEAQRRGLGVGYLPRPRIEHLLHAGELQVLELNPPLSQPTLSAAWRRGHQGKALQWFIRRIKDTDWDRLIRTRSGQLK